MKHYAYFLFAPLLFAGCGRASAPAAFNVPSLVGLNINQVHATLGTPGETESPVGMPTINGMVLLQDAWIHDQVVLRVDFDNNTGKVVDFFIPSIPGSPIDDLQALLDAGGLEEQSPLYRTQLLNPKGEGIIPPGLMIIPK